ncbi:hypothetical protein BV25DRAFT_1912124 [Artomyces pyxidatus]|uniref:Uncharacterized protein n=1 Tax=Artomyces pyxidatus TaxID=48021 RepID=A0ACB8TGG7_9AGAM|nr:hypothetical protein BV25DRAFT_1912124 [Artomyces pyxidatus]
MSSTTPVPPEGSFSVAEGVGINLQVADELKALPSAEVVPAAVDEADPNSVIKEEQASEQVDSDITSLVDQVRQDLAGQLLYTFRRQSLPNSFPDFQTGRYGMGTALTWDQQHKIQEWVSSQIIDSDVRRHKWCVEKLDGLQGHVRRQHASMQSEVKSAMDALWDRFEERLTEVKDLTWRLTFFQTSFSEQFDKTVDRLEDLERRVALANTRVAQLERRLAIFADDLAEHTM